MKLKSILAAAFLCVLFQGAAVANEHTSLVTAQGEVVLNDPATIINAYVKAIGGTEKIAQIRNSVMTAEAAFMGQVIQIKTISDAEFTRMLQSTSVGGNEMQKTILLNGKAQVMAMGQVQELPEEMVAILKTQTYMFPEQNYEALGFAVTYVAEEEVEGEDTHKLEITAPNGMVTHEFYSASSGLKVRTSSSATGDISYSDYQEVEGVLVPMSLKIKNPMLPEALETKITSIKFNQELSDADFQ